MTGAGARGGKEQMATLDEIGQEKQRSSERLARLDGERTKLGDQLNELEIAERILTRFGGKPEATERRRRGRSARTAPAAWGAQCPRPPASTHGVNERRHFEGCPGAWRWRHRKRSP